MRNLFTAIAMLTAIPSWLWGQQSDSLALGECLERAVQQSFLLMINKEELLATKAAHDARQAGYYPHFFVSFVHDRLFFPPYNYRQQAGTASLDWAIGEWLRQTAVAEAKQQQALESLRQETILDVIRQVALLYVGILRIEQELGVSDEQRNVLTEHMRVAEALWQAGIRTELDVLQTRERINGLEEERLALETEKDNLHAALLRLLHFSPAKTIHLLDFADDVMDVRPDSGSTAISRNPALQSLQLQAESQRLKVRRVEASLFPIVQFQGGYVVDEDPTAEGNYWQVGVGIRVPLFLWGQSKLQGEVIKRQAQALRWQEAQTERELKIRHSQLLQQLNSFQKSYQLQKERLAIAERSRQIATVNYRAGLITNLEYLDTQTESRMARLALNETRLVYVLRLIEIYTLSNQVAKVMALAGTKP